MIFIYIKHSIYKGHRSAKDTKLLQFKGERKYLSLIMIKCILHITAVLRIIIFTLYINMHIWIKYTTAPGKSLCMHNMSLIHSHGQMQGTYNLPNLKFPTKINELTLLVFAELHKSAIISLKLGVRTCCSTYESQVTTAICLGCTSLFQESQMLNCSE